MDITETVNSLDNRIASLEVEMKLHRQTLDKMIERLVTVEQELSLRPIRAEIVDKGWGVEIAPDTHRTVTLRIPKGMGLGEALIQAYEWGLEDSGDFRAWCFLALDTDLQKALDEVQG